ncbi:glycosyl transferase, partial [Acinetobacter baumannii]
MLMIWIILASFLISFLLTGYMRHYALKKNIIDNPNERSSHTIPTPRGGGVSIVI